MCGQYVEMIIDHPVETAIVYINILTVLNRIGPLGPGQCRCQTRCQALISSLSHALQHGHLLRFDTAIDHKVVQIPSAHGHTVGSASSGTSATQAGNDNEDSTYADVFRTCDFHSLAPVQIVEGSEIAWSTS